MKQSEDNSQAVTKVKTVRQQAEQPSNPPIPSNRQVRQRQIEERQKSGTAAMGMESLDKFTILVLTIFIFDTVARVNHMVDLPTVRRTPVICSRYFPVVSLTGNGDPIVSDGGCKHAQIFARARGSRSDETQMFGLHSISVHVILKTIFTQLACHAQYTT